MGRLSLENGTERARHAALIDRIVHRRNKDAARGTVTSSKGCVTLVAGLGRGNSADK
jgi:hypothetical protein